MRSLITGATGFVGRRLVRNLVSHYGSQNVVCLIPPDQNALENSGRTILKELGVQVLYGDVRTWQLRELPDFDVLFHLAASTESGAFDHSTNDVGTAHLLDTLKTNLPGKRVMYISTTATIDRNGPAITPLDENSPCHPRTEYGKSKLRAENLVKDRAPKYGFDFAILRFATVYGFGTRPNGLFDIFGKWVRNGHFLSRINWPGRTGLIHVDDAVKIVETFATLPQTVNETFCLVTESPPIGDIPRFMAHALGIPYSPINIPNWFWKMCRLGLQFPGLFRILPAKWRNPFWRLSLIADHGLWCDGTKMKTCYPHDLILLKDGIRDVMGLSPNPQTPAQSLSPIGNVSCSSPPSAYHHPHMAHGAFCFDCYLGMGTAVSNSLPH